VTFAFVVSGLITAFAGVVLGSKLTVASTAVGPNYLLPAFTAALLGSTAIRPGRVNVIGTLVAVFVLAVAVAGLQQMGAQFYVEPLFNGFMLIAAVGLAVTAQRRRARIRAAADAAALE
jgi:ribose transport system permease protein